MWTVLVTDAEVIVANRSFKYSLAVVAVAINLKSKFY